MNMTLYRFLPSAVLVSLSFLLVSAPAQDLSSRPRSGHKSWADGNVSEVYKKWFYEEVPYIITDQERADFKQLLSDKQRDDFIRAFWERRNPLPGATENKFKEEHYRRLAYANTFSARVPGWKTDRGRIYIMYGPPERVEYLPYASDPGNPKALLPESELWHYSYIEGIGEDIVLRFVDACGCGDLKLTMDHVEKPVPSPY
jgi:GWxTD domain-containing protein